MKSIDEQIRTMEIQWPGFKVTDRDERRIAWEGILAPDKREHLVRIRHRLPMPLENISLREGQPRVQVIRPLLEMHPDYDEGPLPHVYWVDENPSMPILCLFSPELREWSPTDLIAHTTIFWANEWLYFYEGWLVTKKWRGGGRHLPRPDDGAKRLETV